MQEETIGNLTKQQTKVLEQIVRGKCNYMIALELRITERTVTHHINQIFTRLKVENRTQAAVAYLRMLNPDMKTNLLGI